MQVSKLANLLEKSFSANQAKQIHCQIVVNDVQNLEPLLIRQILKCAAHYSARTTHYVKSILRRMRNRDAFSASCIIRYLSQHGQFLDAIDLYSESHASGISPNTFAVSSALKSCARILCKLGGLMIHGQVQKLGFSEVVFVQTALLDFYSKLGDMVVARKVFDEIRGKNVVSWNSLLGGYVKHGNLAMAQSVFDEMPVKDVVSWNSMVSGYARGKDMEQAYQLFRRMPQRNSASWNAMVTGYIECGKMELARSFFEATPERSNVSYITMISAYSKCGNVESARELYDEQSEKDLILYNAMIACYAQNSRAKEALLLLDEMVKPNAKVQPDKMTLCSAISACSQLGDSEYGRWIESYMRELGIGMDDHLITSFIDLYTKCGNIDKAGELFSELRRRDVVAYTAMILGCGINGRAQEAMKLFDEMIDSGIVPNLATYTGILTAYSHVGLVEEGYHCFKSMQRQGLVPTQDHYSIMVDLLGKAGRVEEGYELIKSMRGEAHAGVWGALLLGCSLHNNVEIAEIAWRNCVELEGDSSGYCSLLANVYASVGRWEDATRLRRDVEHKIPGSSWTNTSTAPNLLSCNTSQD